MSKNDLSLIMNLPLFLFVFFVSLTSYGQINVDSFISEYNHHIDSSHSLDNVRIIRIAKKVKMNSISGVKDYTKVDTCYFGSDGFEECINSTSGKSMDMSAIPPPKHIGKNFIKYELNFISPDSLARFRFIETNDSIVVLEKKIDEFNLLHYTFETETKDLIEIKRIQNVGDKQHYTITTFHSYQKINGVLVPQKISYQSETMAASLEYGSVRFYQ